MQSHRSVEYSGPYMKGNTPDEDYCVRAVALPFVLTGLHAGCADRLVAGDYREAPRAADGVYTGRKGFRGFPPLPFRAVAVFSPRESFRAIE